MSGVAAASEAEAGEAAELAARLALPLLPVAVDTAALAPGQLALVLSGGVASLHLTGPGAPGPVALDFSDPALAQRRKAGHNELIGRAVGWKADRSPTVLDGTAGFGRDAFVLADLGCMVHLCEREPVMAALLQRAIDRARHSVDAWLGGVARRMTVQGAELRDTPASLLEAIDVIYLDPMFCQPRKTAPGKSMQVLQLLTGMTGTEQSDAPELLQWALREPVARVVVKRPRKAPPLAGARPSHSLSGRSVRFDVYVVPDGGERSARPI